MEFRRLGDALLRSPLVILRPPSCQLMTYRIVNSSQRRQLQKARATPRCNTTRRSIKTSATDTPAAPISNSPTPDSSPTWFRPAKGHKSTTGTSIYRSSPEEQALLNHGNSSDDLLSAINASRSRSSSSAGFVAAKFTKSSSLPDSMPDSKTGYQVMQEMQKALNDSMPTRAMLRLTPRIGRTVHVGSRVDIGKGFRLLEQSCSQNKVRVDARYQTFHERPGLKRKRLKSKRWKTRFLNAFKATISRVKQLRAQGW